MPTTFILSGPQGIGKSRQAQRLALLLGCTSVIDPLEGDNPPPIPAGALAVRTWDGASFIPPAGSVVIAATDEAALQNLMDTLNDLLRAKPIRPPYASVSIPCRCNSSSKDGCACIQEVMRS